jgi:hypothetical protein
VADQALILWSNIVSLKYIYSKHKKVAPVQAYTPKEISFGGPREKYCRQITIFSVKNPVDKMQDQD